MNTISKTILLMLGLTILLPTYTTEAKKLSKKQKMAIALSIKKRKASQNKKKSSKKKFSKPTKKSSKKSSKKNNKKQSSNKNLKKTTKKKTVNKTKSKPIAKKTIKQPAKRIINNSTVNPIRVNPIVSPIRVNPVVNPIRINPIINPIQINNMVKCSICLDDVTQADLVQFPGCNHQFCSGCVREQANIAAREISIADFKCAQCNRSITENEFRDFVPVRVQYQDFIARRTARDSNGINNVRSNIITREEADWLTRNTKACPNCNTRIEKNGGCLHMTCSQPNCRHQFCWRCLSPYTGNGIGCQSYNCSNQHLPEVFSPVRPTDASGNQLVICNICNQQMDFDENNCYIDDSNQLSHIACYFNQNRHEINNNPGIRGYRDLGCPVPNCRVCNR